MAPSKCKQAHCLLSNIAANDFRADNHVIVKTLYKLTQIVIGAYTR